MRPFLLYLKKNSHPQDPSMVVQAMLHLTSHVMKILKNQIKTHMGVVKVITWLVGEEW